MANVFKAMRPLFTAAYRENLHLLPRFSALRKEVGTMLRIPRCDSESDHRHDVAGIIWIQYSATV